MRGLKLAVCFLWQTLNHSFASTNRVWYTGKTFLPLASIPRAKVWKKRLTIFWSGMESEYQSHWDSELTKFCPAVWHCGTQPPPHSTRHPASLNTASSVRLKFLKDVMPSSNLCLKKQNIFSKSRGTVPQCEPSLFGRKYFQCFALALILSFQCSEHHKWITIHFHWIVLAIWNNVHNYHDRRVKKKSEYNWIDGKSMLRSLWSFPYRAESCTYTVWVACTVLVFSGR